MNLQPEVAEERLNGSSTPLNFEDWSGSIDIDDIDELAGGGRFEKINKKREASATVSRRKKKPKGMPKRPLSAYNIFFQRERVKVLEDGEGNDQNISFEELGRTIGMRWKTLPDEERKKYEDLADQDSIRYKHDMDCFNEAKRKRREERNKECLEELKMPHNSSFPFEIKTFVPVSSKTESNITSSAQSNSYTGSFRDFQQYANKDGAENNNTNMFHIPPGTEVSLPDASGRERKYTVQYKFYRMSRAAAEDYMEKLNQMQQPRINPPRSETHRPPFTHFWG